jgi:hypothetical protein
MIAPKCHCLANMQRELEPENTRLLVSWSSAIGLFPTLQTARLNGRGRPPVVVVPSHCPFCGVAYAGGGS